MEKYNIKNGQKKWKRDPRKETMIVSVGMERDRYIIINMWTDMGSKAVKKSQR